MAQKLPAFDPAQRDARLKRYQSVPTFEARFPKVEQIVIEIGFYEPDGKLHQSKHKRIFVPGMQAYFDFQCPMRDCKNGGFDLMDDVVRAVASKTGRLTGSQRCEGKRPQTDVPKDLCAVELRYDIVVTRA